MSSVFQTIERPKSQRFSVSARGLPRTSLFQKTILIVSLAACLFLLFPFAGSAQPVPFDKPSNNAKYDTARDVGFAQGSFIVAPIPFQNPSLGGGLALGGAYLFKNPGSAASSIGFGGFKTNNGSQGYGLGFSLNFNEDKWKTRFFLGDVDLNYDLYVLGVPVPISQTGRGARAEVLYGLSQDLFVGAGLGHATSTIAPNLGLDLPGQIEADADLKTTALNLILNWDRRDDTYYPTNGTLISGDLAYAVLTGAGDRDYLKAVAKASGYKSMFGNGVFAWQATACASGAEAPFFDSCSLGGTDSLRGFSSTEFINNALFSVQAEYRGALVGRLGYVVFAGAGSTGDDIGEALAGTYRSAAGIGARFRLSKKFPLDYSFDVSYNDADESLVYVYVGQRF
jgi:outer membrane protein assembly factor BamA